MIFEYSTELDINPDISSYSNNWIYKLDYKRKESFKINNCILKLNRLNHEDIDTSDAFTVYYYSEKILSPEKIFNIFSRTNELLTFLTNIPYGISNNINYAEIKKENVKGHSILSPIENDYLHQAKHISLYIHYFHLGTFYFSLSLYQESFYYFFNLLMSLAKNDYTCNRNKVSNGETILAEKIDTILKVDYNLTLPTQKKNDLVSSLCNKLQNTVFHNPSALLVRYCNMYKISSSDIELIINFHQKLENNNIHINNSKYSELVEKTQNLTHQFISKKFFRNSNRTSIKTIIEPNNYEPEIIDLLDFI